LFPAATVFGMQSRGEDQIADRRISIWRNDSVPRSTAAKGSVLAGDVIHDKLASWLQHPSANEEVPMDNTKDEGESRSTRAKAGKTGDSSSATDSTLPPPSAEERAAANESAPRSNRVGPKEPTLLQRLQNHMAAIAYAEAGEYQSARELLESVPKSKTVLLVIEGDAPDPASVSHALNLCKRTGGDLEVLQVLPLISGDSNDDPPGQEIEGTSGQLVPVVRRALSAGVTVRITMQKGEVNEKLFDYARRHKDVAMIILDSPRLRTNLPKDKVWPRLAESVAQQLSIPLITVMPKEPARA
jgi:hypothetical protein